jgi:hypothetical protein
MRTVVLSGLLLALGFAPLAAAPPLPGRPEPQWDDLFRRQEGWTGGDATYSLSLGDGRTMWLFADSWIGPIKDGGHGPGSRLVNNTIAIHKTPRAGAVPDAETLQFYWGPNDADGHPTAWIQPQLPRRAQEAGRANRDPHVGPTPDPDDDVDANTSPDKANADKDNATQDNADDADNADDGANAERTWYWVADAFLTPGPVAQRRFGVFLWHIGHKAGAKGVWSFESRGGALAMIENPAEEPQAWKITQYANPHAKGANRDPARAPAEISWGCEVLSIPAQRPDDGSELYIYGVRETDTWDKQLVLARAPGDAPQQFDRWRFRTQDGWSKDPRQAATLAHGMVNEFSVSPHSIGGQKTWVLIHSEPLFGDRIWARTAPRAEGPWSARRPLYRVEDIRRNKNYFTYAAKAQPHLSRPGELLITYIINSHDFGAAVRDADIYRPRFVSVPLEALIRGE